MQCVAARRSVARLLVCRLVSTDRTAPHREARRGATDNIRGDLRFDMFHRRCGYRVTLSNNNSTATRIFSEYDFGLVFSAEPLQDDELFEVTIDKKVYTRANTSLAREPSVLCEYSTAKARPEREISKHEMYLITC